MHTRTQNHSYMYRWAVDSILEAHWQEPTHLNWQDGEFPSGARTWWSGGEAEEEEQTCFGPHLYFRSIFHKEPFCCALKTSRSQQLFSCRQLQFFIQPTAATRLMMSHPESGRFEILCRLIIHHQQPLYSSQYFVLQARTCNTQHTCMIVFLFTGPLWEWSDVTGTSDWFFTSWLCDVGKTWTRPSRSCKFHSEAVCVKKKERRGQITQRGTWLNVNPVLGSRNKHIKHRVNELPGKARSFPHKVLFLPLLWEFISLPSRYDLASDVTQLQSEKWPCQKHRPSNNWGASTLRRLWVIFNMEEIILHFYLNFLLFTTFVLANGKSPFKLTTVVVNNNPTTFHASYNCNCNFLQSIKYCVCVMLGS